MHEQKIDKGSNNWTENCNKLIRKKTTCQTKNIQPPSTNSTQNIIHKLAEKN